MDHLRNKVAQTFLSGLTDRNVWAAKCDTLFSEMIYGKKAGLDCCYHLLTLTTLSEILSCSRAFCPLRIR
jgi:hypothetical protein